MSILNESKNDIKQQKIIENKKNLMPMPLIVKSRVVVMRTRDKQSLRTQFINSGEAKIFVYNIT